MNSRKSSEIRLKDELPGYVLDSFKVSFDDNYVITLSRWLGVLKTDQVSSILAFFDVYYMSNFTLIPVDMSVCVSVNEGLYLNDTLDVLMVCSETDYVIYSIKINPHDLDRNSNMFNEPLMVNIEAQRYVSKGPSLSLFINNKIQYTIMGEMVYSLENIVLENDNKKQYLNVYRLIFIEDLKQFLLSPIWSSLSDYQLVKNSPTKFVSVKLAKETDYFRKYQVIVVSATHPSYRMLNITINGMAFNPVF